MTIEQARAGLVRPGPREAAAALERGAVLVDIRSDEQRERDGTIPGAVRIARNVLEWRCAPTSQWCEASVSDPAAQLILLCQGGFQSSLAAATLQQLGLPRATDLDGGFVAWRAAGLPVTPPA